MHLVFQMDTDLEQFNRFPNFSIFQLEQLHVFLRFYPKLGKEYIC